MSNDNPFKLTGLSSSAFVAVDVGSKRSVSGKTISSSLGSATAVVVVVSVSVFIAVGAALGGSTTTGFASMLSFARFSLDKTAPSSFNKGILSTFW